MSLLPPSLSVTVDMKRRACVLDTRLALSTYGLLLAQRLSSEFDLWLSRELWQILDNTELYKVHPDSVPLALFDEANAKSSPTRTEHRLREVLAQWELARTETDLAGLKIFWIGDALSESMLPARVDQHLVDRYEALAQALEQRCVDSDKEGYSDFLDAAALSVALTPYRSFVLTELWSKEKHSKAAEPIFCEFLRKKAIHCYRLGQGPRTEIEREFIRPMLVRSGVSELMWTGLNLAAVHLLAPRAAVIPPPNKEESASTEALRPSAGDESARIDWWDGAVGFWYTLDYDRPEEPAEINRSPAGGANVA